MGVVYVAIGFVMSLLVSLGFIFFHRRQSQTDLQSSKDALKHEFASISQEALKGVTQHFLELAKAHLSTESTKAMGEFKREREVVDLTVKGLKEELQKYEGLIREFEKDREVKYSSIETQIKSVVKTTETLQGTTQRLNDVLSNVKTRGQWGERMAEDILGYSGLQKGLHYDRNSSFETSKERPDYIFYLPGDHKLVMDVKFPFNNYLKYVDASSEVEKAQRQKDFLADVKARINEIAKKDYLPSIEGTLDYIILFIPNEQVYSFVNEKYDGIMDEALRKKIILCSPWTLYAVLKIIWQAWQNYHYSQGMRDVIVHVHDFLDEFEKFKEKMDAVGINLGRAQKAFDELAGSRQRQLERKIDRIKDYGLGQGLVDGNVATDIPSLPEQTETMNDLSAKL